MVAIVTELRKLGAEVEEGRDYCVITPCKQVGGAGGGAEVEVERGQCILHRQAGVCGGEQRTVGRVRTPP